MQSLLKFDRPLLIGHRGFKEAYPENTMAAFEAAVKAGAKMVELDVHLSKDRELVVIHDDIVDRTTGATGPVSDYTLTELRKLDAGSWFDPRFANEKIPTLNEVLTALIPRVLINIEIKSAFEPDRQEVGDIEMRVMDLIRREKAYSSVLISSFDPRIIKNVVQMDDSPPVAFISETAEGEKTVDTCRDLSVFSFHPKFQCLDKKMVSMCHAEGIFVFPYNVNTDSDFNQALQMDVDGVIVDDPAAFKQWSQFQNVPV